MYIGLGILLLVAGAILAFAVTATVEGLALSTVGWIMMMGGALAVLVSAIALAPRSHRSTTERHVSDDGQTYIEDSRFD